VRLGELYSSYRPLSTRSVGTIFYDIFGSGQLQPWAMPPDAVRDNEVDSLYSGGAEKKRSLQTS